MKKILFLIIILFCCNHLVAQVKPDLGPAPQPRPVSKPTNVRVIEEYVDDKGNQIRTIQYEQNQQRYTETIIKPLPKTPKANLHKIIKGDTLNKDSVEIAVSKSKYKVDIYYKREMIRSYIAVFGPNPMQNKCKEGDRCTPEGHYRIQRKNAASQYNKFLLLDYPNDSAKMKFNAMKETGKIPQTAKIGGNVGIHGIWPGGDDMIELGVGWTDGCIALRNKDIDELYTFVGVGTRVVIKR
jgi:murein L,D-transpeptidase YafK